MSRATKSASKRANRQTPEDRRNDCASAKMSWGYRSTGLPRRESLTFCQPQESTEDRPESEVRSAHPGSTLPPEGRRFRSVYADFPPCCRPAVLESAVRKIGRIADERASERVADARSRARRERATLYAYLSLTLLSRPSVFLEEQRKNRRFALFLTSSVLASLALDCASAYY